MDSDVIVVGAGPAGLMLAGELRLAGAAVTVLERLADRSGESRGVGFTTRTMEIFDQRGLLSRFGELDTGDLGHFAGIPLDFGELDGDHPAARTVPQSQTETVLEKWAFELGADVRRGVTVTDVTQTGEYAEVTAAGKRLRASYVVGCDGGRSVVRQVGGFDFPGTDATRELLLADVRGIQVAPRMIGRTLPAGMVMAGVMPGGVTRLIVSEAGSRPTDREGPVTYAEVARAWRQVTGEDVSAGEPVWVSAFGNVARQADTYRRGRFLLAGDAAHVHLAAGGQGMNTSIQDSVNLGWKLAAVVRGTSQESLLDTYHDERHPVGQRLLTNTQAQGHLILSGPEVGPLRAVLTELTALPEVRRHLAAMVTGIEIRYDTGGGTHPLLGLRMPHWTLSTSDGQVTTTELLRPARGLLLDLTGNQVLLDRAALWADRIDLCAGTPADDRTAARAAGTGAVLVRPDGHVAWAAPGSDTDLPTVLRRWFGPPRDQTKRK
ncbi:FAD-dependent monooxygenase [Actinophytocola sediminis]